MSCCETHLSREKGSRAGEIAMIVCGVLLGALILAVMGYALASIQEIVFSGIFIGAIPAVGGVALIVYAIRRGKKRRAPGPMGGRKEEQAFLEAFRAKAKG